MENQLIASFLDLIHHHPFSEITIATITSHADTTRTYFYQFFSSKADIAQAALFNVLEEILANFSKTFKFPANPNPDNTLTAVQFISEHKQEIKMMLSIQNKEIDLQKIFQSKLEAVIKANLALYRGTPSLNVDYFALTFSTSMAATINWLLQDETSITDESASSLINATIFRGLIAVL